MFVNHSLCVDKWLTCNHLSPALIQVRGNHVPHGCRSCRYPGSLQLDSYRYFHSKDPDKESVRMRWFPRRGVSEGEIGRRTCAAPTHSLWLWWRCRRCSVAHTGRTHLPRVITGSTCSVSPAKGVVWAWDENTSSFYIQTLPVAWLCYTRLWIILTFIVLHICILIRTIILYMSNWSAQLSFFRPEVESIFSHFRTESAL